MSSGQAASDDTLIAGMAAGDRDAASVFVRRFQARVYGLAVSIVVDRGLAEEVAQEAFVRAWLHAASFDPRRGRAASWLLTITRNLAVDALRMRRDQPTDPERLLTLIGDDGAEQQHGSRDLLDTLRVLPAEQSRAIVLAVYYGLTAREVAETEKIPVGTAKTRIRRGLTRLRDALGVSDA